MKKLNFFKMNKNIYFYFTENGGINKKAVLKKCVVNQKNEWIYTSDVFKKNGNDITMRVKNERFLFEEDSLNGCHKELEEINEEFRELIRHIKKDSRYRLKFLHAMDEGLRKIWEIC